METRGNPHGQCKCRRGWAATDGYCNQCRPSKIGQGHPTPIRRDNFIDNFGAYQGRAMPRQFGIIKKKFGIERKGYGT